MRLSALRLPLYEPEASLKEFVVVVFAKLGRRMRREHEFLFAPSIVIAGLDPAIHGSAPLMRPLRCFLLRFSMDHRVIGERSDAVLRTAMPGGDEVRGRERNRHCPSTKHIRAA
jgi:hypothetical protein